MEFYDHSEMTSSLTSDNCVDDGACGRTDEDEPKAELQDNRSYLKRNRNKSSSEQLLESE